MKSPETAAVPSCYCKRRHDQTVGELFGVVLHACVADRRQVDQPSDLAGGSERADPDGAHRQLAVADDSGGKDRFALGAHHRQAFARDGLLIDHRITAMISPSTGMISPG